LDKIKGNPKVIVILSCDGRRSNLAIVAEGEKEGCLIKSSTGAPNPCPVMRDYLWTGKVIPPDTWPHPAHPWTELMEK
jgi:hypothetical protein